MKQVWTSAVAVITAVATMAQSVPADALYKSKSMSIEKRVSDLLRRMTLEEKAGQLNQLNGGVFTGPAAQDPGQQAKMDMVRRGLVGSMINVTGVAETRAIQQIAVQETRLGIPLLFAFDVIHGYKTIFPIPLAEAGAWDPALSEEAARIAAKEASAEGLHWTFAPMVDCSRDPRWGRVMEGAGEDPYLGSIIGAARVRGFQGNFGRDNVLACVKHFAMYGALEAGREYNHVAVDRYNAWNHYMPPYEAAVKAGAATVMNSFNVFEGIPASGHRYLLTDVLKHRWGFKGFVVSDWNSLGEMMTHGYAASPADVVQKALEAGSMMDMESRAMVAQVPALVKAGKLSMATLDDAVGRILYWKFKLGLFDDPFANCNEQRQQQEVFTPAHRAASRYAAQRSIVLLKNQSGVLPLATGRRLALVGYLANSADDIFDFWVANAKTAATYLPATVADGLTAAGMAYSYAAGYNADMQTNDSLIADAVGKAAKADVVLVNIGLSGKLAGEDRSLAMPEIPAGHVALLKALKQTGKPVVALVSAGRPLVLTAAEPYCDAIVYTWILGTEHGHAVADVLLGKYNPAAKTVMSFPYAVGQIPVYYNHMRTGRPDPTDGMGNWYSRFRDIPNEPLYPFGYGLSYTQFVYGKPALSSSTISRSSTVEVSVQVTNAGTMAGEEIVQLYICDVVANRVRPVQELKGFEKILLQPGESKTVRFTLQASLLSYADEDGRQQLEPGVFEIMVGPNSRDVQKLTLQYQ